MKIGIIGGSGLYQIDGFDNVEEVTVKTPFGEPSDSFRCGQINGVDVIFLARHGRNHSLAPYELNHKANIFAMKTLGVEKIISMSAVGSLKEKYAPLDFVIVDQYIDRTKRPCEDSTFFGHGIVAHIAFSHPTCADLSKIMFETTSEILADSAENGPAGRVPKAYPTGTYVNMEGPAFSTLAESELHRQWGADLIGMTNLAEAKLCREAEICYSTTAMVTDYDCWHQEHDAVTVEMVIDYLMKNADNAKKIIAKAVQKATNQRTCKCKDALKNAIFTQPGHAPVEQVEKLKPIVEKYLS